MVLRRQCNPSSILAPITFVRNLFDPSQIVSWDRRNFFIENRYESRRKKHHVKTSSSSSASDTKQSSVTTDPPPIVYFTLLLRITLTGNMSIGDILEEMGLPPQSPPPLPDYWISFLEGVQQQRKAEKAMLGSNLSSQLPVSQLALSATSNHHPLPSTASFDQTSRPMQLPSRL